MRQDAWTALLALGATLAALCLNACGQSGASVDRRTHDSCLASLTSHGLAASYADPYCACLVTELDKLSAQDRKIPAQNRAAAKTCFERVGSPPATSSAP